MTNEKWATLMRNEKLLSEMGMIHEKFPLSIGEEMVRNERTLLSKVEDGKMIDVCRLREILGVALLGYTTQSRLSCGTTATGP